MSALWFAQTVVGSVIGAAVTFVVFGALGWAWAKRKLVPFLMRHPAIRAMLEERDD